MQITPFISHLRSTNVCLMVALAIFVSTSAHGADASTDESSSIAYDLANDEGYWGPQEGDWELTLGGTGSSDQRFNAGGFGGTVTIGYFTSDNSEFSLRQTLSFSDFGNSAWNGATRFAYDYHFSSGNLRPFAGVNVGGAYGDGVKETLAAGLEAGLKYYVKPETFIVGMVEYQWLFDDAGSAKDTFEDGQFLYLLGVGFNF